MNLFKNIYAPVLYTSLRGHGCDAYIDGGGGGGGGTGSRGLWLLLYMGILKWQY